MNMNAIFKRKSVRKYTEEKLTTEQLDMLARAGMAAPSAANRQPWAFVLIDDKALIEELSMAMPYAHFGAKAPAAIVVCGDLNKSYPAELSDYWIQDCSAASQNILLQAEEMGLGATWTAVYPETDRIDATKKLLNLPEHLIPLNLIPVGYPAGDVKAKDNYKPENIFYNRVK